MHNIELNLEPQKSVLPKAIQANSLARAISVSQTDLQCVTMIPMIGIASVSSVLSRQYSVSYPTQPKAVFGPNLTVVGLSPRAALAVGHRESFLFEELETLFGSAVALTDQSGGMIVLRVVGHDVWHVLSKGIPIDFDAHVFCVGHVVTTMCDHVNLTVWRCPDQHGMPSFEIALFRSTFLSFWDWFVASSEEFGLQIEAQASL